MFVHDTLLLNTINKKGHKRSGKAWNQNNEKAVCALVGYKHARPIIFRFHVEFTRFNRIK